MTSRMGLGLLVVAALACAHKQEGPAGTLQLYGAALGRGDYRAAYALTSTAFQQRTSIQRIALQGCALIVAKERLTLKGAS